MTQITTEPAKVLKLGMVATTGDRTIRCALANFVAKTPVKVGCPVALAASSEYLVENPSATGANILGIAVYNPYQLYEVGATDKLLYYPKDAMVSVLTEGDIVMRSETAGTVNNPVFFRHTVDAALTFIGGVAKATGAGLDRLLDAYLLETCKPGDLVRVYYSHRVG